MGISTILYLTITRASSVVQTGSQCTVPAQCPSGISVTTGVGARNYVHIRKKELQKKKKSNPNFGAIVSPSKVVGINALALVENQFKHSSFVIVCDSSGAPSGKNSKMMHKEDVLRNLVPTLGCT